MTTGVTFLDEFEEESSKPYNFAVPIFGSFDKLNQGVCHDFFDMIWFDCADYGDIVSSDEFRRLGGLNQLSQASYYYRHLLNNHRAYHSLAVLYWARETGKVLRLSEYDQRLLELYALLHDIGHLPWSHTTENLFRKLDGFSHEQEGIEKIKRLRNHIEKYVMFDDLVQMFTGENPLSKVVDGEVGVDRLAYLNADRWYCGYRRGDVVDVRRLVNAATVSGDSYATQWDAVGEVMKLLRIRAENYKMIYFEERVQIAQAVSENLLYRKGLSLNDIRNMTDLDLEQTLKKRKDMADVLHCLEHWKKFPMLAGSLKLKGFEEDDYYIGYDEDCPLAEYKKPMPGGYYFFVEGITTEEAETVAQALSSYHRIIKLQRNIEEGANAGENSVFLCTTVSTLPQKKTLVPKPVPIMTRNGVRNLLELYPGFGESLTEQMQRNYSLRIVTYPEFRDRVYEHLKEHGIKNLILA